MKKKKKPSNDSRPLYHYTETDRLAGILRDGVIKTTDEFNASGEKPATWLSYEPHWEPSANKMYQPPGGAPIRPTYGIEEMAKYSTPARIGVDPSGLRLMTWKAFRVLSGRPKELADAMEALPKEKSGNPDLWRASFAPVPESAWLNIEEYRDGKWCAFEGGRELPPEGSAPGTSRKEVATAHPSRKSTRQGGATGTVPIDYSAIRSLPDFREAVDGARVVFARDKRTGKTSIIYGLEMIRAIASEVAPQQELDIVEFEIDMHTTELEHLIAAVETVFGFHEYEAGKD